MDRELKENPKYPRLISLELYEAWRKSQRTGDPALIAKKLRVSKQIIDYALMYGNVKTQALSDQITKFFETRLLKEKEDAARLSQLINNNGQFASINTTTED